MVSSFPKETVKRTPAEQPDVDEMEDDLEDLDDLDDLEDGYMGVPLRDDEDSDDSDASDHLVIETMALQCHCGVLCLLLLSLCFHCFATFMCNFCLLGLHGVLIY